MITMPSKPELSEREQALERPQKTPRQARDAALARLIAVLEARTEAEQRPQNRVAERSTDSLSQLARLRAARAAYALNAGPIRRVGYGAWLLR